MKFLKLFLVAIPLFALSTFQKNVLLTAYKIGNQYRAIDGHKFNDTICAIILTESSAGKFLIGDNYFQNGKEKPFLLKSLGVGQVRLETAILVIKKYPQYFPYARKLIHKNPLAFKVYSKYLVKINYYEDIISRYQNKHTRRAKKVLRWAKNDLRYYKNKMKKYNEYYKKDLLIAQYLLADIKFNIRIAVLHLITNYNIAYKRKMWNPYFKAISRYNGGWKNKIYYKKVMKNMEIWRKIKYDYFNKR